MSRSILDYFPKHLPAPREGQIKILLELEEKWDRYDTFIISAPVAAGKSAISATIAAWSGDAAVVTPNNILRNQYAAEYPAMHVIRKRSEYWCTTLDQTVDQTRKDVGRLCLEVLDCTGCNQYREDLAGIAEAPVILANYYGYKGYKYSGTFKSTLIVDEAHNLTGMLRELSAKKLWQHESNYPKTARTRLELMQWAETKTDAEKKEWPLLDLFCREILSSNPRYLFEVTKAFHGKKSKDADDKLPLVKMCPVDTSGLDVGAQHLWPTSDVRKLVLLSATLSEIDEKQFGLERRRVLRIEVSSPISTSRRPVILPENHASMAYRFQELNMPKFVQFVHEVAETNIDKKGLIHVPYNLAEKIKPHLESDSRYVFHGRGRDKIAKYQEFRETSEPKILVASGMSEGVDLPGDLCRWQIITKVPYPSMADPALRYMAGINPQWYSWQAIRDLIQASGRVCRGPEDYGITYIYDSCFVGLYSRNSDLMPKWFVDAVVGMPEK